MDCVIQATDLLGCYELSYLRREDSRGWFLKVMQELAFREAGLRCDFREQYITRSRRNVLRGLHFQVPPADHAKVVVCLEGEVFDVAVDLRRGSPTYRRSACFRLRGEQPTALYLPAGLAHGFLVTSSDATMLYMVTSIHSPEHDRGVLWSSIGIDWPVSDGQVLLSDRDRRFPSMENFDSPFVYNTL